MRLAGATALVAVLAFAGRAAAHSALVESSVGLDAAMLKQNVESHLGLRFGGGIKPRESIVELVPEHGEPRRLPLVFGPGPGDVAVTCPGVPAGRYVLRYHVVSTDGHATDGTLPLRVAAPE